VSGSAAEPFSAADRHKTTTNRVVRDSQRRLWGVSLIAAPALFAVSTFFWVQADGRTEYGAIGGAIIALATVFWIPAFTGLFDLVRERLPRYATWGLVVAIYGCLGGAAFGLERIFVDVFRISHDTRREHGRSFRRSSISRSSGRDRCFP
jgi:hypothetical protein